MLSSITIGDGDDQDSSSFAKVSFVYIGDSLYRIDRPGDLIRNLCVDTKRSRRW